MSTQNRRSETLSVPDAPGVPGLTFRSFRGEEDYPVIAAAIDRAKKADGIERSESVEDVARYYASLINCDPFQDMLFAEIDGEVIGYSRVWWADSIGGERLYTHFVFMGPQGRGNGVLRAMLWFNELRLRDMAMKHPEALDRLYETWAADTESDWEALLLDADYQAVRHSYSMVRPTLDDIPELRLPDGLEVRPIPPEHYRTVWDAAAEAFRDEWGYQAEEWSAVQFEGWLKESTFDPSLWQVGWDGEQVAGMVLNFVNAKENEEYGRQRGYTEAIAVRRPWRRRGLARALIARSFQVLKDRGMSEAALGVDAENPSGALGLYKSMGFDVTKRFTTYRKAID